MNRFENLEFEFLTHEKNIFKETCINHVILTNEDKRFVRFMLKCINDWKYMHYDMKDLIVVKRDDYSKGMFISLVLHHSRGAIDKYDFKVYHNHLDMLPGWQFKCFDIESDVNLFDVIKI